MAKTKAEKITSIEEEIRQLENRRKRHRSAGTGQNAYAAAWGFWKALSPTAYR